jgi:hypothetical protein
MDATVFLFVVTVVGLRTHREHMIEQACSLDGLGCRTSCVPQIMLYIMVPDSKENKVCKKNSKEMKMI